MDKILKFGIPKGSLEEATLNILKKAGFKISLSSRSYYPTVDDEELSLLMLRPQEMARYVEEGILDIGITGKDWVYETEADVEVISELNYSKATKNPVRWVVAVHQDSGIKSIKDLEGKRVATEAINLTKKHFEKNKVNVHVEFSWGATEVKCPKLVDAIVDITETGSSLKANNLVIIDEVMVSTTQLIANRDSLKDQWKRDKIEGINILLQSVLEAENKVGLMLNTRKENIEKIIAILPALYKPTISQLSDPEWVAINTILDEKIARNIIPLLKLAGASGIVEYSLNKVII